MDHFQTNDIKRLIKWSKFVGTVLIFYSVFIIFKHILPCFVGAIPGLMGAFMGKLIYDSSSAGEDLLIFKGNDIASVNKILGNLNWLLVIIGMLMFVVISYYLLLLVISFLY